MAAKSKEVHSMEEFKEDIMNEVRTLINATTAAKVDFEILKAEIKNKKEDKIIESGDILRRLNELNLCIEDLTNRFKPIEARFGL